MLALLELCWPCISFASLLLSISIGQLLGWLWLSILSLAYLASLFLSIGTFLTGVSSFPNGLNTSLPIVGSWLFRSILFLQNKTFSVFFFCLFLQLFFMHWFLVMQGNPIDWVSTHRYHHQFCDSESDPHSPTEGFWFSHMSWLFDTNSVLERVCMII